MLEKGNSMRKEKMTTVLLPKGEWLEALLLAFRVAGLELSAPPRGFEYTFVEQALPILFQAIRSKEVLGVINDEDTSVTTGFTGTDIALEQNLDIAQPRFWRFPLDELNPAAPKPAVYLGATPHLRAKVKNPTATDIAGTTIYTEYPNLTQQLIDRLGVTAKIKPVQGGSEGRWRVDERNGAIVTIRNTDATMRANEITPLLALISAGILYIEGENTSPQDKLRIDDLREVLYRNSSMR